MKKTYSKPMVDVENFYLSDAISGCGTNITENHMDTEEGYVNALMLEAKDLDGTFTTSLHCAVMGDVNAIKSECYHTYGQGFTS